ncbi:biopolymer transport protein ExbD [Thalassovita litoralis]|jgi:biopolymer transport protein ExbD|uniref:Biopolymer transport protein ExbD n=1 Tax=Thalassovita litoralis TaxID=1010611 RepID=A0A521C9E7_9RHOB|nr:biopolymer transporter ExbD [Thalassovita litoralis]SMO55995.1 biopolymer transport protein ExbD [Thalassovita litoralis]
MKRSSKREPTIALINVVFLMLVFFMVAGTLLQPMDKTLTLVRTDQLEGLAPPKALVIHPDGRLTHAGEPLPDAAAFLALLPEDERQIVRIVPDRALAAQKMVQIATALRVAGAEKVMIVTERGLE